MTDKEIVWEERDPYVPTPRKPSYRTKVEGITIHISEYGGWYFSCVLDGLRLNVSPCDPKNDLRRKTDLEYCKRNALEALYHLIALGAKPDFAYERN